MWSSRDAWFAVTLLGVVGLVEFECTSSHNLHNLLRHPHYADKHHHHSSHSQHPIPHLPIRTFEGRPTVYSAAPTPSRGSREEGGAPWQRAAPKDYYKMNGYPIKSTSATKGNSVDPSEIPQELLEVREANEHFVRMRSGARCQHPRPQVVCVRDLYPEKEFLPRCTLLHRCTESAGCCEDDTSWCAPKAMQEVALYFYVLTEDHRSSEVEKLFFVNHTECECQMRPPSPNATTSTPLTVDTVPLRKSVDHFPQGDQNRKCRSCPNPFCVRELEDGRCTCDCFDRHRPCIRVKRGREALQDADRRCVLAGHCNIPDCDYGAYDPDKGRCPKRPDHENFKGLENGKRPHPNSRNPNHRWNYFERD